MQDASSFGLTQVLAVLAGFAGVGGLLGWAQFVRNWRRPAFELLNLEAQTKKTLAEARKLDADRDYTTLKGALELAQGLRAEIERYKAERDEARADRDVWKLHAGNAEADKASLKSQVEVYEEQIDKVRAVLKANNLEYPS